MKTDYASMGETAKKGVEIMLGDPKKAIAAFSIPIAVALFAQQSNNLVDSFWVTSLGAEAMAALGLVFPIYAVLIGIGSGLGIGTSAAIARKIGMGRAEDANRTAMQSLILCIIISAIATPVLLVTAEPILVAIGAGPTIDISMDYAVPLYLSTALILISGVMSGILRGEGAARKSMYIQVAAAATNLVLDPILIYTFDMGVAGAAWATVAAFAVSIIMGMYWYLAKKNMFLTLRREHMRFSMECQRDIMSVGLPQSVELSVMNLFNITFNFCIVMVGTTDALAIYTVAWRIVYLLMIPAQAMGGAIVSACSAEFGMKRYDMIKKAYVFSVKSSVIILVALSLVMALLAEPISAVFTSSPDMEYLHNDMVVLLRIFAVFVPFMSLVFVGSSLLQAVKRSKVALMSTVIRNLALTVIFVAAAFLVGTLTSLWWAMTLSEIFGGLLMGYWAYIVLTDVAKRDARAAERGK
ncbi:MAG: MATE family efflux transporter [Candidatus Methanoplasma sp.]|jgi:putative MATE family efflux protein|nr:MATE family efflux transporter [Candidatus Methanoplasma sp.]